MDPATLIAAITTALDLVQKGLPIIQQAVNNGQITPQQQADLLAKFNSLKADAEGQFAGPEWQIQPT